MIPVVDLRSSYLLPGLIDAHAHLFFTQTKKDSSFENALEREARLGSDVRTARAKDFLKAYLTEGFTSVFDLGNSGQFLDVKLRDEIHDDPDYPLLLASGPGISNGKGQFASGAAPGVAGQEYTLINDGQTDWNNILKPYLNHHVDILKIYFDNDPSSGGLSSDDAKRILQTPGVKNFKKVTAHAIAKSSMEKLIESSLTNVEHASMFTADKRLKNIFVTVTGIDRASLKEFDYFKEPFYQYELQIAKQLSKNGNKILFGPDFYFHSDAPGFSRAKKIKQTIDFFKEAGFSNKEILSAMTYNPALSVKMNKLIGVIRPGAFANLIAVKKDPLLDIDSLKTIECIINKGRNFCPTGIR